MGFDIHNTQAKIPSSLSLDHMKAQFHIAYHNASPIRFRPQWLDLKGHPTNACHDSTAVQDFQPSSSTLPSGERLLILPDFEAGGNMILIEDLNQDIFYWGDNNPDYFTSGRLKMRMDHGKLEDCVRIQMLLDSFVK